ncbi:PilZ domain-containing protein [Krasilnikovia cinnamomea]|uniref:PilZ domain-containing protein n=1 Tax=Krasilnikovia cinnamomea TaxID=349313 RepID=A0A4Q7ZLY6_9ACTN|nr:PilZ domain-containing protein [Krasilnikovia cinnamomea]RZU51403.1 PilZ domain-containing protein [Krasilnikovia cinnamomea]
MGSPDPADLPDVNDLVDVTLDSRTEPLAAVIGAVTGDTVLLTDPIDRTGRFVLPDSGEGGLLVWGAGGSLRQAPVEVLQTSRQPAPAWTVRLTAPAARCQRRAFVRASVNLPVVVKHSGKQLEVIAIDISEGGLRCNVLSDAGVKVGDQVVAEFDAGQPMAAPAMVVRVLRGDAERPTELGLSFTDLKIREADNIRKYVFGQLLEQRRRGAE